MGVDIREFVADDLWLLIGIVTFALISLVGITDLEWLAGAISIVGWFLLTPIFLFWGEEIAAMLFDESEPAAEPPTTRDDETEPDALAELKRRYAEGKIDDEEFEHRLDRLLAVDDALEGVFDSSSGGATTDVSTADEPPDVSVTDGSREHEREVDR